MQKSDYSDEILARMEQIEKNIGVDAAATLRACAEIEKYAVRINDTGLLGYACYYYGETYYILNDGENLFRYMTRALSCLDRADQWELMARAYNIMAITSVNRGNQPIAMDYYLTGINYCKKYKLEKIEAIINVNIGNLYMSFGEHREAQHYIESAYEFFRKQTEEPDYLSYLAGIYYSLAKCYLLRGMTERAAEYVERLERECGSVMGESDLLYAAVLKARIYHAMGRTGRRDECIAYVRRTASVHMAIMDIFDDMYEYCELLLEIGCDEEFWNLIDILEKLTKQAQIINMQRKIIALKIRYYRKHQKNAEYLQAAGLYFAMSEIMERENQYMVVNMLDVRNSLEQANEKRREAEERSELLQKKSETDALTGLANRFRLNAYMEEYFQRALDNGTAFAVEILDIDYFKQYNDNYGHQAGDICIAAIAEEIKCMQSDWITCARYGGDEFVIVYHDMGREEVYEQASQLKKRILERRIEHRYSKELPIVTISQGICWDLPSESTKTWDYLHMADIMLYKVKKRKRNGICLGSLSSDEVVKTDS